MEEELPGVPQCIDLCSEDEGQVVMSPDTIVLDKMLSVADFFDFDRSVLLCLTATSLPFCCLLFP